MGLVKYKIDNEWTAMGLQYPVDEAPTEGSSHVVSSGGTYTAIQTHVTDQSNPHNVTKEQLGLGEGVSFKGVSYTELTEYGTEVPKEKVGEELIERPEWQVNGGIVVYDEVQYLWSGYWTKFGNVSQYQMKIQTTGVLYGNGSGNLTTASPSDIPGISYTTEVPTAPYIGGNGLKIALLEVDPAVHYDGWIYLIK